MKYLCLVYFDEQHLASLSPQDMERCIRDSIAYDETLRANGQLIAGHALAPVAMATTVRRRNEKISTTDGPFAETKEQLGGFMLIQATDLDDAIRVAAQIPCGRYGSVEVRPVRDP